MKHQTRPTDTMRQASRELRDSLQCTGNEFVHEMAVASRCLDRSAGVIEEMLSVIDSLRRGFVLEDIDDRVERWLTLLSRP